MATAITRRSTALLLAFVLLHTLSLSASAQQSPSGSGIRGCVSGYDPTVNYFPSAFSNETFALPLGQTVVAAASDFSVQYANSFKVVTDSFAGTSYVLYLCGTPQPTSNVPSDASFIQIPIKSVVLDSTVLVTFMQYLGTFPLISGADSLSFSPCLQLLMNKTARALSPFSASLAAVLPFSTYPSLPPTSAFPNAVILDALQLGNTNLGSGKEDGFKWVSFDASTDPGPLKRAEWIKYLGMFFDQESRAAQVYSQISLSYSCLNGSFSPAIKPVIAWMGFYQDTWTISNAAYKLQLALDAGATNPNPSLLRAFNLTLAKDKADFSKALQTVDIVIDESYAIDPTSYGLNEFLNALNVSSLFASSLSFVRNKAVWRNDKRLSAALGLDWFESAIAQPHVVLNDCISIAKQWTATNSQTSGNANQSGLYYLRNIALGEKPTIFTYADCPTSQSPYEPLNPILFTCNSSSSGSSTASLSPSSLSTSNQTSSATPSLKSFISLKSGGTGRIFTWIAFGAVQMIIVLCVAKVMSTAAVV